MAAPDPTLERVQQICLSLPDTKLTMTWGHPHFRVKEKIFCGFGERDGKPVIGFKAGMDLADVLVQRPGFRRAPYVGHRGWVQMDLDSGEDWDEVRGFITESFRLIAPKRILAKLDGPPARKPARKKSRRKRPSN